jgi:hypothetical protein
MMIGLKSFQQGVFGSKGTFLGFQINSNFNICKQGIKIWRRTGQNRSCKGFHPASKALWETDFLFQGFFN